MYGREPLEAKALKLGKNSFAFRFRQARSSQQAFCVEHSAGFKEPVQILDDSLRQALVMLRDLFDILAVREKSADLMAAAPGDGTNDATGLGRCGPRLGGQTARQAVSTNGLHELITVICQLCLAHAVD